MGDARLAPVTQTAVLARDLGLAGVGIATGAATLAGGALVSRLRGHGATLTGFGVGAVIGVALLDLLPEAIALSGPAVAPLTLTVLTAAGFIAYVIAHRLADWAGDSSRGLARRLGPASLVAHSLMDGLGIGLAFAVSSKAGVVVAAAVLAHDCLDGANTVTLSLAGGAGRKEAHRWLIADAAAPLAGLAASQAIHAPPPVLGLLLAFFAGLFLYIGASELLPRSRAGGGAPVVAAAAGVLLIYGVVRLGA